MAFFDFVKDGLSPDYLIENNEYVLQKKTWHGFYLH